MTELIKQRVVGMLLVIIAGVVFLPDLLDGEKQQTKEEFKKIPTRPNMEQAPIASEFPTEEVLNAIKKAPQIVELKADDVSEEKATAKPVKKNFESNTEVKVVEQVSDKPKTDVSDAANAQSSEVKQDPQQAAAHAKFDKNAWILQLGSFKHKENVDALKKRLTEAGFKVFIKPVETKAGLLSKVFVGPEIERKNLEKAQLTLKELTGLDGKITQFDPIN